MATPTVRTVAVELDRTRHLRMDMNALCTAEDLTGKNFLESAAWKGLGLRDVRALLFSCLKHEDIELTIDRVGELLHLGNLTELIDRLVDLYRAEGQPEGEDGQEVHGEAEDGEGESPLGVKASARVG